MILYHGSIEQVRKPEIRKANRALDYGSGFYTTTTGGTGYVNVYELDETCCAQLDVLHFTSPTEQWLDFVMANRMDKDFEHQHDIVIGPVANDRVYAAFALYEGGLLNKAELINELKTYVLVDQWLFHTERSLGSISFKEAKEVLV